MHLKEKYLEVRNRTEALCSPLQVEDYVPQPVAYASPPKWHLAHSTWFFEEMILKKNLEAYQEYHPDFGFLFNSYYNTIGQRTFRADRGNMTRPGVSEVYAYRAYVNEAMMRLLNQNLPSELEDLIELGLNHEQQHQELLLTDLKYTLGHNPIFPVYDPEQNLLTDTNTESGWIALEEGIYEIGHDGAAFCFDNELTRHKVYLQSFEISKALVTNGEYLTFMEAGGYAQFEHWLDEGWSWVNENRVTSPLYWHKINGKWHYFTLAGLKEVDPDAILCHVSYYEAQAYASWRGLRLPTEFEWEAASGQFNWGKRWEWTNSAYLPYPGYHIAEGAVGEYNGKFMINQMVLRGASVATAPDHSRKTYRNFFHPHFQWQYSGIRLSR
ncbi:ergothioneine biosynthesis protein EgtB [Fluviicola sp.]|uniref:ergothioneine biosynthesis protein EgtB n=1 Tax=Fluviicola sp. TaxID=1917219 RepID=UPI0031DCCC76